MDSPQVQHDRPQGQALCKAVAESPSSPTKLCALILLHAPSQYLVGNVSAASVPNDTARILEKIHLTPIKMLCQESGCGGARNCIFRIAIEALSFREFYELDLGINAASRRLFSPHRLQYTVLANCDGPTSAA